MPKKCDNLSVGVIVRDRAGMLALLERRKFPVGFAPPAGHIDDHGSHEQTAVDEVSEEIGIALSMSDLKVVIDNRRVDKPCRREGGDHHYWTVYEAATEHAEIKPDADEAKGAKWYSADEVQALADRTRAYQAGDVPEEEWVAKPGLEDVWLDFLSELKYVK